ncbi:helix-turn-helix domain-containing protein [Pseudoroseomonas cervicalis]|uniref:helix-turn-helix domain-containing protein n=1 Tax=Teichococcus cervicalis TaxID=204525 RepID=UPI0022F164AF|nr:helix-turn-helix transcriptional regulator [Pseudoroseomonas cervicalis]WBV43529.1 helix-turn-helix transcriptional regulator [Pseudoroseomonas cervicalis]
MGEFNRKQFGQRVRQLRLVRALTQEQLAQLAGLHPTYLGGIERGERNLGLDNVLKLAKALAVHPSELFAAGDSG